MIGVAGRRIRLVAGMLAALGGFAGGAPGAAAAIPVDTDVPSLAPVVEKVIPGVVNIAVKGSVEVQNPLMADPFFRQFFNLPNRPLRREVQSAGSGVIVDAANGYVLTNNHVVAVAQSQQILVTLKDNRSFPAKLIGRDPETDVAVLKIKADNLSAVQLGDSDRLRVGDYVLAIGNPFGLGQTVTSGIVSALGRTGLGIEGYEDFIQTDAPINPGNSGGALIDLRGQLVGINTAIVGPSGGNVGIGFAVPISIAKTVMEELIRDGEIKRGRIGVGVQELTPDIASSLNLQRSEGAVVTQVAPGSAAARAGLRPGDVVTAIDGAPVHSSAQLRNRVGLAHVGETLTLSVIRDAEPQTIKVTVEAVRSSREETRQQDEQYQ